MKNCAYCGRENADDATRCQECGTDEFAVAAPPSAPAQKGVEMRHYPIFCEKCLSESLEVGAGEAGSFLTKNGPRFFGSRDECPVCGSVVQDLWFNIFWVPLGYLGTFRVKHLSSGGFLSRKLGTSYSISDAQSMLDTAASLEDVDRKQAIIQYAKIAKLFPGTIAGQEAARNIQVLTRSEP